MELTRFRLAHNLTPSDDYVPPELLSLREPITPEQFEELCSHNRKLRLELTSTGELIIMPPTGLETGRRNSNLTYQLETWARMDGTGICCDSGAMFVLPNGACRSPDASWFKREKLEHLTRDQMERFGRFSPDFVIELRSRTDRLTQLRDKMLEYIENGVSLGWLIDPVERRVHVYRPDQEPVVLEDPKIVSGDPFLPGFNLNVIELW